MTNEKRHRFPTHGKSGQPALFRNKVRRPVCITLTELHHTKVNRNMRRLGLSRSDLLGLLVEKYADVVEVPSRD